MNQIDLNKYTTFVEAVTSKESNDVQALITRLNDIDSPEFKISLLMTSAIGIAAEGGEFSEIVKKMVFQGKPINDENIFHMKRELGDIIWYWINACRALSLDPNDVIQENINKLSSRYPGGSFDAHYSENRVIGDL